MDWALLGSWVSVVVSLLVGAFVYGRLTQAVNTHEKRLDGHDTQLDHHAEKLAKHESGIGELRAWRDGYNAATRASHDAQ